MKVPLVLLLSAISVPDQCSGDAFFLHSLDLLGSNSVPHSPHSPPVSSLRHRLTNPGPHRQPRKQNLYPGHKYYSHHQDPRLPLRLEPVPHHRQSQHHRAPPQPADPGANVKLDYGGWTAIDFDDTLPHQRKRKVSQYPAHLLTPQIVTLEAAIASAPPAQSDDLVYTHSPPPEEPPAPPAAPPLYEEPVYKPPPLPNTVYEEPAPAPAYQTLGSPGRKYSPSSTFGSPVPAVPYIPSTLDPPGLRYNNPAIAPAYQPPAPSQDQGPRQGPGHRKPLTAKHHSPKSTKIYKPTTSPRKYQKLTISPVKYYKASTEPPRPPVTARPRAVLPVYTPSPAPYTPPDTTEEFPIVALITADSDIPEEQKYVSFSIDGAGNTEEASQQAEAVTGVYVQPPTASQDELYYIYYQDPELDPSYGVKIQSPREAPRWGEAPEAPSHVYPVRSKAAAAPLADFPVYDYDEAETFSITRNDPAHSRRSRQEGIFQNRKSRYSTHFHSPASDPLSRSSVTFTTSVGGKSSGFSYHL